MLDPEKNSFEKSAKNHSMMTMTAKSHHPSADRHEPRIAVRAVVIQHGKILLSRQRDADDYWHVTPGGGIEEGVRTQGIDARVKWTGTGSLVFRTCGLVKIVSYRNQYFIQSSSGIRRRFQLLDSRPTNRSVIRRDDRWRNASA